MKLQLELLLTFLVVSEAFVPTWQPRRHAFRLFDMDEEADGSGIDGSEDAVDPIEVQEEVIEDYRKNLSFKRTGPKESDVSCGIT